VNYFRPGLRGAGIIALSLALVLGCRPAGSTVLGTTPAGSSTSISALIAADAPSSTNANTAVRLQGAMVEKCPVAGCWFKLRDATGTLKVDTKFAGFVVLDVPLNTTVSVAGRLEEQGKERVLVATGLRY
jgi:uncharacterized protein YdeI (BOF family)